MPKLVRVKCFYVFTDIKTFIRLTDQSISEIRRFSLNMDDTYDGSSNALFGQLQCKVEATRKTFISIEGYSYRLFWKDPEGHYVSFYNTTDLLEAIDVMIPSTEPTTDNTPRRAEARANSLSVLVCNYVTKAPLTQPGALFPQTSSSKATPPTTSSVAGVNAASALQAAAGAVASTITSQSTTTTENKLAAAQTTKQCGASATTSTAALTATATPSSTISSIATITPNISPTTSTATAPPTTQASPCKIEIKASQQLTTTSSLATAAATAASSSNENPSDEYDVIKLEKEFLSH